MTRPNCRTEELRVLLVEDNVAVSRMLVTLLRKFGYEPRVAYDGPGALREVERGMPDVVLLDIGLPGLDGWEVARRIRGRVNERRPFIIAVTGYGADKDRELSERAGIDLHLTKPADPRVLGLLLEQFASQG
jgi:CheY-like chemotaxis protein